MSICLVVEKASLKETTQNSTSFRMDKLKFEYHTRVKVKELHTPAQVFLKNILLSKKSTP